MLEITPLILAVIGIFSIALIMLRTWYFEAVGLITLGVVIASVGTLDHNLIAFLYVGLFIVTVGIIQGVLNLFSVIGELLGRKYEIDIFHRR